MSLFKIIMSLAAIASFTVAAPTAGSAAGGNTCGNGQKLSCCNSGDELLGLNCLQVPVLNILGSQTCGSNVAACCQGDNTGLLVLDAGCSPITL
ncbi:high-copy hsp90 suppressor [Elasticomyces elasticus]|nr:high-copy hsp90 suppressor [Elasticomyces elasticus]KAK5674325.1 high-copy hsp90 suppressor [Elasticomyces elasticus]